MNTSSGKHRSPLSCQLLTLLHEFSHRCNPRPWAFWREILRASCGLPEPADAELDAALRSLLAANSVRRIPESGELHTSEWYGNDGPFREIAAAAYGPLDWEKTIRLLAKAEKAFGGTARADGDKPISQWDRERELDYLSKLPPGERHVARLDAFAADFGHLPVVAMRWLRSGKRGPGEPPSMDELRLPFDLEAALLDGEPEGGEPEPEVPGYVENVVSIPGAEYEIPATVCLPAGEGPFPAVVMLHGTGSTRDEAGDGYRFAAPVLAEQYGIATIRIDFPGNGDSTADYMQYNFHSAVADAKAAADYMAALDCIDGDAIGVMGWSQGGTDALLACAWEPETFKSLVTWAGAPDMWQDGFFTEEDYAEAKANGSFVMEFDWRDSLNVSLQWCDDVTNTDVLKEFAQGYDGPVLAIAGTEDDTVDPRWSVKIVEASLHPMSRTCFIEGMDHTFNVFTEEDLHTLRKAVDATGAFFVLTLAN